MDGIFISYRRDDSAGYAGRLYDRLVAHFGAERVFMDVEGIEPGLDFVVAIEEAVSSCRVLIAVIGDEWTISKDAAGRRRLDDPNDFIRLETGAALQRGIRVVPVLVGGAVMPLATDLPDDLKALTRRQAVEINHKQWEASIGELIRTLEGILKTSSEADSKADDRSDDGAAKEDTDNGGGRRWILPAGIAAVVLAAFGIWMNPVQRSADVNTETIQAGRSGESPGGALVPASPARGAKPPAEPKGAETPATGPAGTVRPETAPAVAQAPLIREFKAEVSAARTRLCYRVSHAESLSLSPRPGELSELANDCIDVRLDSATTFTLTARNGSKITRKTLAVAPRPATASPPEKPARAEVLAPAAVDALPSTLPVKGERWVYRSSGKWPTSPKRRFEIVAQAVADGLVTDELRLIEPEGGSEVHRSRGNKPDFIAWHAIGPEFSPYFGTYVALAQQGPLSGFSTPDIDPQWTQWYSKAEVVGQESISVPAGTFNAFKVEVWSSRTRTGSVTEARIEPVRVRYLIWYAPQFKRYVRMQRSITTADNSEGEKDVFELVAHRSP